MPRIRRATLLACALVVLAAAGSAGAADWPRFGRDAARTNVFLGSTGITRANVKDLALQRIAVPGTPDTSPVYLGHATVAGATHDVFITTTLYGRTVATDASTGVALWTYVPPGIDSWERSNQYTTASPVAAPGRNYVYAAAPDGRIHKLRVADGTEVMSAGWPATVSKMPVSEKISSALNIAGRYVIVTTASFQDRFPYQGHVVTLDRSTGRIAGVFNALCAKKHFVLGPGDCAQNTAGIWGRGGAVVEPGTNRLLIATGNAALNNKTAFGDSILELSPAAKVVRLVWNPPHYHYLQVHDFDLGSGSPAMLRYRGRKLVIQADKQGVARLFDLGRMRRHGKPGHMPGLVQNVHQRPAKPFFSAPAIWQKASRVYLANFGSTVGYKVRGRARKPRLRRVWRRALPGTTPVLAGGLLYVYDQLHGKLNVLDPKTGKTVRSLPAAAGHWQSPVVADGRIALGVGDARLHEDFGTLYVWRLPGR